MAKKKATVQFLKTYRFMPSEKDPIINCVHGLMKAQNLNPNKLHGMTGVSATTLYNWFDGPTRRPQWATVSATLAGMGYEVQLTAHGHKVKNGLSAEAPRIIKAVKVPAKNGGRTDATTVWAPSGGLSQSL